MTEGDLGLGTVAQLDICTGTAVCSRAADKASCSTMDTQEGGEGNSLHADSLLVDIFIRGSVMIVKRITCPQTAQMMTI